MTTFCNACGKVLAADIQFCPNCGTPTSAYYARFGAMPSDPTARPEQQRGLQQRNRTDYGPLPNDAAYEKGTGAIDQPASFPTPYGPFNPYASPPPPPPPHRRRGFILGVLSGGLLVALLLLASIGILISTNQKGASTPVVSTTRQAATTPFALTPRTTAVVTPTPTATPAGCGKAFSDEFSNILHPGWDWINITGQAHYQITTVGTLLLSTHDGSDLNAATNYNAPRLLQPISGNFTLDTLVEFPTSTLAAFEAAGILVWQDQNNFLRLERNSNTFDFEQQVNGAFNHNAPANLASATIALTQAELQLKRDGDTFTASWRQPGQSWQTINTTVVHLQNIQVGIDLIDQGVPQVSVQFHYFRISCP